MSRKRRNSRGSGIKVDLSGVEVGGKVIAEGAYIVAVEEATLKQSQGGNDYISFEFQVSEGGSKGYKLYHNCSLQPQALFSLKSVLAALGFEIPTKAFDLDLNDLIGLECSVEVAHELYEGKKKSRIVEFDSLGNSEDYEDGDSEDGDIEELLEDLNLKELKELAKALGIKVKKKDTEEDVLDLILDEDEEDIEDQYFDLFDDEDDSEEDEDFDEDEEDEEDYNDMTLKELRSECRDRGLKIKKGSKKDDLVEMLEEDDED